MKHQNEIQHDRIRNTIAEHLRNLSGYKHVWENVNYRRNNVVGEIDVLAQRSDGRIEFYEVKINPRLKQARKQYEKFKSVFDRPSVGYMASLGLIRRLE